jgi:hypothetical protein
VNARRVGDGEGVNEIKNDKGKNGYVTEKKKKWERSQVWLDNITPFLQKLRISMHAEEGNKKDFLKFFEEGPSREEKDEEN